jgi:predicted nuclease with TOPRIM domain
MNLLEIIEKLKRIQGMHSIVPGILEDIKIEYENMQGHIKACMGAAEQNRVYRSKINCMEAELKRVTERLKETEKENKHLKTERRRNEYKRQEMEKLQRAPLKDAVHLVHEKKKLWKIINNNA